METVTLKSGVKIPKLGLGTDNISAPILESVIQKACESGYSLFDTATGYQNYAQLMLALKKYHSHALTCIKINNGDLLYHKTIEVVIENILQTSHKPHIDYLLLHNSKIENYPNVFQKLVRLKKQNIIKSIGVSNFTMTHFSKLLDVIEHIDINQVELHPLLTQSQLITFCEKQAITIMAYRPFAHGAPALLENNTLKNIASKYNKQVSQIILRWLIQQGHCVIPKASNETHLKQNINIFDFKLIDEDISKVNTLNSNMRTCTGPWAEFDD